MKKRLLIALSLLFQLAAMAQLNTERMLTIGQNALYFNDYVLSIQYFNQVISIKPQLAEPYLFRAIAKIQLSDYEGADKDCSEALERNPFMPQAYYARGFSRSKLNYPAEAEADFTKALEFSPNSPYLLLSRMDAREKNKDLQGALADAESYLKLNPKGFSMHYEKGRLQMQMKDTLAAEKTFNDFLTMDSVSSFGWSARALLRMQQQKLDDAYTDYTKAIAKHSNYVGDYINRGIINVQRKNFNEALLDYNAALKIDKSSDLAYYNRGLLRASLGDTNNAILDFNQVLKMDKSNYEAYLRRAMLLASVGQHKDAIADYKFIIEKYPYFIPAYGGIAESMDALGNKKEAFRYRQLAHNIENNKDYLQRKTKEELTAKNKMAGHENEKSIARNTEFFNRFSSPQNAEATTDSDKGTEYSNSTRGTVQENFAEVINERNFTLSYYAKPNELRRTNRFYPVVEKYNQSSKLQAELKITNNEIPLSAEMINGHFKEINLLSEKLSQNTDDADLYFHRAIEFAAIQDFKSSIEDLNKAIQLRSNFMLAYFLRANTRYKNQEYLKSSVDGATNVLDTKELKTGLTTEKKSAYDAELIMRDYDKVLEISPDFSFAHFNKANILCTQKDFKTAISEYSKAIEIDTDFAEAYFNRGLSYLFVGDETKGLKDLSKAGELGIYQSYNLMQRYKK